MNNKLVAESISSKVVGINMAVIRVEVFAQIIDALDAKDKAHKQEIEQLSDKWISQSSKLINTENLQLLHREYGSEEPFAIRNSGGMMVSFYQTAKYQGQEERYEKELLENRALAEFLFAALSSLPQPPIQESGK